MAWGEEPMGRKKMTGTDAEKAEVRVRFPKALRDQLEELAREQATNVAAYVRRAVIEQMKRDQRQKREEGGA